MRRYDSNAQYPPLLYFFSYFVLSFLHYCFFILFPLVLTGVPEGAAFVPPSALLAYFLACFPSPALTLWQVWCNRLALVRTLCYLLDLSSSHSSTPEGSVHAWKVSMALYPTTTAWARRSGAP